MDAFSTDPDRPQRTADRCGRGGVFAQCRDWFAIVDSSPPYEHGWKQEKIAQITQVKLVDDLDGGEAAESVAFSLDGKAYEIDLSETHAAALRDAFAPFIGGARRAGNAAKVGSQQRMSTVRSTGSGRSRGETAAIREWANANGLEVSTRGRISSTVLEAYENRATLPAAAPVTLPAAEPSVEVAVEAQPKPKRRIRKKADADA